METAVLSRGWLLALGAVMSGAVSLAGRRARVLTPDGAAAAVLTGTLVVGFGGIGAGIVLVTFFVSSSLFTRWRAERKHHPEHRHGRRASQVLANGAAAAGASVWWGLTGSPLAAAALAGSLAAATADTWATEIGTLSPEPPRLITTLRQVPAGTSGAVTWRGTIAGILGATLIAGTAWAVLSVRPGPVLIGGVVGMTMDSILGATAERSRWMNNDAVNLSATMVGALLAAAVLALR
jgi:uncharacterized protein (TIGR00297 family)